MCVIDPPMEKACFEHLFAQIHTALAAEPYSGYAAWSFRPEYLDEEDAATMRNGRALWTEARPDLSSRRLAEVFTHEIMHVVDYARTGRFPEGLPLYKMHEKPRGYFRYVYGPNSLEQRILNGLDYSCLQ